MSNCLGFSHTTLLQTVVYVVATLFVYDRKQNYAYSIGSAGDETIDMSNGAD